MTLSPSSRKLRFSPSGSLLASGGSDGRVRIVRSVSGDTLARIAAHGRPVTDLAFSPDEKRIFDAVVRPERTKANGNAEAEVERLRQEVERGEKLLANDRFVANASPDVVEAEREKLARYRRELDAVSG